MMAEMITLRAYLDDIAALLESESVNEVISHCRHILQHQPHNIETYRLLGKALLQKGHFDGSAEQFNEAADIFRRVLSVEPNDYISHLGMSEVCQEIGQLDQAIWHMERAYEQQPGNMVLQDALRQLYVVRDGETRAPQKIQMTRAALARQYASGRLFDQALIELRTAIEKYPDRIDLELLLAEFLWDSQHYVEAGEIAGRVLDKLPDCLPAQRILAQLWLHFQRPVEAQRYLQSLEALDPYLAARLLRPQESVPDPVRLERLDYGAQMASSFSGETPDWIADLGTLDGGSLSMRAAMQPPNMPSPPAWPQPDAVSGTAFDDQVAMIEWTSDQADDLPGPNMSELFAGLTQESSISQAQTDRWPVDGPAETAAEEAGVPDWFADLASSQITAPAAGKVHEDEVLDFESLMADSSGEIGQMDDWLSAENSDDLFPNMNDLSGEPGDVPVSPLDAYPPLFDETTWLPPLDELPPSPDAGNTGAAMPFDSLFSSEEGDEGSVSAGSEGQGDAADWLFLEEQGDVPGGIPDSAAKMSDLDGLFGVQEPGAEIEADFGALFGSLEPAVEDMADQVQDTAAEVSDLGGLFDAQEPLGEVEADFGALFGSLEPAVEDMADQVQDTAAEVSEFGGLFDAQEPLGEAEADFGAIDTADDEPNAEKTVPQSQGETELTVGWRDSQQSYASDIDEFDALFGGAPIGIDHSDVPSGFTELLQGASQQHQDAPYLDLPDVSQIAPPEWISAAFDEAPPEPGESQPYEEESYAPADQIDHRGFEDAAIIAKWAEPETESLVPDAQDVPESLTWEEDVPMMESSLPGEMAAEAAPDWLYSDESDLSTGDTQRSGEAQIGEMGEPAGWMGQDDAVLYDEQPDLGGDGDWLGSFAKPEVGSSARLPGDVLDLVEEPGAIFADRDPVDDASQWLAVMPDRPLDELEQTADSVVQDVQEELAALPDEIAGWLPSHDEARAEEPGMWGDDSVPADERTVYSYDEVPAPDQLSTPDLTDDEAQQTSEFDTLDQAYDPFAAGSPDQVPEYQSAKKTGVLQPNELPSWMAAFSGDQTLLSEEETEEPESISLRDLDLGYEDEQPEEAVVESVVDQDQGAPAEPEPIEPPVWGEAEARELIEEEGEMPSWLAAITSSASSDLDPSLFGVEELALDAEISEDGVRGDALEPLFDAGDFAEPANAPKWLMQARDAAPGPVEIAEDAGDLNALFDEFAVEEPVQSVLTPLDEVFAKADASVDLPWLADEETQQEMVGEEFAPQGEVEVNELDALFGTLDDQPDPGLVWESDLPEVGHEETDLVHAGFPQVAHADDLTDTRDVASDEVDYQFDEDLFADEDDEAETGFSFGDITPAWLRTPKEQDSSSQAQSSSQFANDPPEWLRNALEEDGNT